MTIHQSIDNALEKNIGAHGVDDGVLKQALERAEGALDTLAQAACRRQPAAAAIAWEGQTTSRR